MMQTEKHMQVKHGQWPETLTYSAWVWLTAGSGGDPRGEWVSDGEVGMANAEAEGGIKGSLDRPNKRLNLSYDVKK